MSADTDASRSGLDGPVTRPRRRRPPRWSWVLAGVLAVVGLIAVATRPTAPPLPPPGGTALALTSFPTATLERVEAWVGPIRVATLLSLALQLAVPAVLLATSGGRALVRRAGGTRGATWRGAAVVLACTAAATAPLRWWIGWRHAGEFGFRTSTPLRFVVEELGGAALGVVITATSAALVVWLVRRRPRDWPAVGTPAGTALTAGLVLVWPVVITPLLLAPVPLEDAAVSAAISPVIAASTLEDPEVEVGAASVRTTRVNALVTGFGPARRIVLYDTLLTRPPERVAAVVAHELAHAEHHDIERAVLGSAPAILAALLLVERGRRWLDARGRVPTGALAGAAVVTAVVVLQLAAAPLVAWESRRTEAAADHRALELTRDPSAAVELNRGFVLDDLADPTPPGWVRLLSSHPAPAERIRAAVAYAEREGLDAVPDDAGDGDGGP